MARINEYRSQVRAPGAVDYQRASGRSVFGEALGVIGETVNKVQNDIEVYQKKEGEYYAATKSAEYALEDDEFIKNEVKNYDPKKYENKETNPDGNEFHKDVENKIYERRQKRLGDAPNEYARRSLEMKLLNLDNHSISNIRDSQTKADAEYGTQKYKTNFTGFANKARSNPNEVDNLVKLNDDYVNSMHFLKSEADKESLRMQGKITLHDSALDGKVSTLTASANPSVGQINAMIAELKDSKGKWQGNTSIEKFDQSLSKLENLRSASIQKHQTESKAAFEEEMARIKKVGIDDTYKERFDLNYINNSGFTGKQKESMIAMREESLMAGRAKRETEGMSFQQVAQYYNEAKLRAESEKDPTKFNILNAKLNAVKSVVSQSREEFKKDPIGYIRTIKPGADDLFTNFEANWKAGDVTPEEVSGFVEMSRGYQKQVDEYSTPRIVTPAMSDELKYLVSDTTFDEQGATAAYMAVLKESQKWGPHWKDAVKDLTKDKVFNPTMEIAVGAMDNPANRKFVEFAFKASKYNNEDLNKFYGKKMDDASLDQAVTQSINSFLKSQQHTHDSDQIALKYKEGITNITKYFRGEKSPQEVADIVVNSHYDFAEIGNSTVRIPKTTSISRFRLKEALPSVLDGIAKGEREIYVPPSAHKGVKPEDANKMYRSRVYARGTLANDGDEGVRLVDGEGSQVYEVKLDDKGRKVSAPMKWTWKEIESIPFRKRETPISMKKEY